MNIKAEVVVVCKLFPLKVGRSRRSWRVWRFHLRLIRPIRLGWRCPCPRWPARRPRARRPATLSLPCTGRTGWRWCWLRNWPLTGYLHSKKQSNVQISAVESSKNPCKCAENLWESQRVQQQLINECYPYKTYRQTRRILSKNPLGNRSREIRKYKEEIYK